MAKLESFVRSALSERVALQERLKKASPSERKLLELVLAMVPAPSSSSSTSTTTTSTTTTVVVHHARPRALPPVAPPVVPPVVPSVVHAHSAALPPRAVNTTTTTTTTVIKEEKKDDTTATTTAADEDDEDESSSSDEEATEDEEEVDQEDRFAELGDATRKRKIAGASVPAKRPKLRTREQINVHDVFVFDVRANAHHPAHQRVCVLIRFPDGSRGHYELHQVNDHEVPGDDPHHAEYLVTRPNKELFVTEHVMTRVARHIGRVEWVSADPAGVKWHFFL